MKVEIRKVSDMSEYEINSIVEWQFQELIKGRKCTICGRPFNIKDRDIICSGKDENGEILGAHEACWNKN